MTTVRTRSICHGTVDVDGTEVGVVIPEDEHPYYVFTCPRCGKRQRKDADEKIVALLRTAGGDVLDVAAELRAMHRVLEEGSW